MLKKTLIVFTGLLSLMELGYTVPAWGRRYGIDCSSCHWGLNRLNHQGRMFLLRGHRHRGDEGIAGEEKYNLGEYMSWSSKFRFEGEKEVDPSTKFDVEALSIYAGGAIDQNFSFFFEYYMHERGSFATSTGGSAGTTNRSKLADAYLYYTSDPEADSYWYIRAGQVYPYLIYYYGSGGRLSISRNLTVNRAAGGGNLYTPRDRAYGVTTGYVGQGKWLAEVGIVNSGGGNARPNVDELNNFKDVFGTLEWVFDENGTGIGFYGYSGKFLVAGTTPWEDKFDRYGMFANYTTSQFTLSGGALTGKHDLAPPAGGTRRVRTYYAETGYKFSQKFLGWVRYDHFYRDLVGTSENRLVGISVGVSYRLNNLGRFVIEYQNQKRTGLSDRSLITVELNWLL